VGERNLEKEDKHLMDILISPTAVGLYTLIGLALVAAYIRDSLPADKPTTPVFRQLRDAKKKRGKH